MMLLWLFDYSVRAAALAGLGGLLIAWMRRRTAAIEHAVWTCVAAGMLAMPLLQHVVPATPVHFMSEAKILQGPSWDELVAERAAVVHPNDPPAVIDYRHRWTWREVLALTYFAGVLVFLGRIALGQILAERALENARSIRGEPAIRPLVRSGVELTMAVEESPAVSSPLTFGISSPRIVLPPCWREWPPSKLRSVLAHEICACGEARHTRDSSRRRQRGSLLVSSARMVDTAPDRIARRACGR